MELYSSIDNLPTLSHCVITLGSFDGLHYGHKHVISKVQKHARSRRVPSVLITFHPHPKEVLFKEKDVPVELLTTVEEKQDILRSEFNLDYVIILQFTEHFSRISAPEFLEKYLIQPFAPDEIIIGFDHRFGRGREGDVEFLQEHEARYGYKTIPMESVGLQGDDKVSSSQIRSYLKNGKTLQAIRCLTRPYRLTGVVREGDKRGQSMDFPTANLVPQNQHKLIPGDGVYLVYVTGEVEEGYGMCNIGSRPTFTDGRHTVEVHILHPVERSLYDCKLTVHFFHRLRDEQKFASPEALAEQLSEDKQQCKHIIAEEHPWKQYQKELVV